VFENLSTRLLTPLKRVEETSSNTLDSGSEPENDPETDSDLDTDYEETETNASALSWGVGDHTWSNLHKEVHTILIQNLKKAEHDAAIFQLIHRGFQIIVQGGAPEDKSWLPSNTVFWTHKTD
jgi:hypothetical protein